MNKTENNGKNLAPKADKNIKSRKSTDNANIASEKSVKRSNGTNERKNNFQGIVNSEQFNNHAAPLPDNVLKAKRRRQWIIDDKPEKEDTPESDFTEESHQEKEQEEIKTEKPVEQKTVNADNTNNTNKKTVTIKLTKNSENPGKEENTEEKEKNSQQKSSENKEEVHEKAVATVSQIPANSKKKETKNTKEKSDIKNNGKSEYPKKAKSPNNSHKGKNNGKSEKNSGKNHKTVVGDEIIDLDELRKEKEKEKSKKRIKKYIIAGCILLVGIIIYLLRDLWVPKLEGILDKPHKTIVNDGKTVKGNFPIEIDKNSDMSIEKFGNYFITVDKNHILMYDESGEKSGSFTHNYGSPVLKTSAKRIMVFDYGGNSFRVLTRKKEIYSKNTEKSILMGAVADNGNALVVTQSEKYECKLIVYDSSGSEIYSWEGGKIINVTFTNGGNSCAVCTFNSSGGRIKSVIYGMDFNSKKPKMKSTSLPTLALAVAPSEDNGYFVVGDDCFFKLNSKGSIYFKYEYPGELDGYAMGEKGAAVSCKGTGGTVEDIMFFKSGDDEYPTNSIKAKDGAAKKFKYTDSGFVALKNGVMDAYDFSGNLLATAEISSDYSDFVFINQNAYFINTDEINKIQFKTE